MRVSYRDLDSALRALAAVSPVSIKAVLHAAHGEEGLESVDGRAVTFGLICDARPETAGADRVLGMYINTLPFAYERGARTWRELVRDVFAREVQVWPRRRYPLPAIRRMTGAAQHPIDVIFDFMDLF